VASTIWRVRPAAAIFSSSGQTVCSGWYLGRKEGVVLQHRARLGDGLVEGKVGPLVHVAKDQPLRINTVIEEKLQELLNGRSLFRVHLNRAASGAAGAGGRFQQMVRRCRQRCFASNFDESGAHGLRRVGRFRQGQGQLLHEQIGRCLPTHPPERGSGWVVEAAVEAGAGDEVHAAGLCEFGQDTAVPSTSPRLAVNHGPAARCFVLLEFAGNGRFIKQHRRGRVGPHDWLNPDVAVAIYNAQFGRSHRPQNGGDDRTTHLTAPATRAGWRRRRRRQRRPPLRAAGSGW
jgi:hypothetical protein